MKRIGRNLRRLREAKNLTVDEVRKYLRLGSVQAVYKYETGKSYPPTDALFALMQLYEADLYDVLCGREENPAIVIVDILRERQLERLRKYWELHREYLEKKAG
ncbi:MAG: helix-turn-helix domain-containing protein [Lachnospiraceae bacterium]|nr:helix-turn-helix domain-containing protein [Lachnospiraceae bacterium]